MRKIAAHGVSRSPNCLRWHLIVFLWGALVSTTLLSCGGTANLIQGISLAPGQTPALNQNLDFTVSGTGRCDRMRIDWGDGDKDDLSAVDLGSGPRFSHTFQNWRGGKTVTAIGTQGCGGQVNTRFTIEPASYSIAFAQPGNNICNRVPFTSAPLVKNTLVHITTSPVSGAYSFGIDFGCHPRGDCGCVAGTGPCRYDADGKPGSVAASPFPFPGLREHSLVLRVDNQVVQGGKDVRFTTTTEGQLEICINDDLVTDNQGGYTINVSADQLGLP